MQFCLSSLAVHHLHSGFAQFALCTPILSTTELLQRGALGRVVKQAEESSLAKVGNVEAARTESPLTKKLYRQHPGVTALPAATVSEWLAERGIVVENCSLRPVLDFAQTGATQTALDRKNESFGQEKKIKKRTATQRDWANPQTFQLCSVPIRNTVNPLLVTQKQGGVVCLPHTKREKLSAKDLLLAVLTASAAQGCRRRSSTPPGHSQLRLPSRPNACPSRCRARIWSALRQRAREKHWLSGCPVCGTSRHRREREAPQVTLQKLSGGHDCSDCSDCSFHARTA